MRLFDGGVDMARLRRRRDELISIPGAARTVDAYAEDWADFTAWCQEAGRRALPASADTLELYLVGRAEAYSLNTLRRRVTGIAAYHLRAGERAPASEGARKLLREMARERKGGDERRKRAIAPEELRRMVLACGRTREARRDRAVLLLGFASGLRRSELSALDLADVRFVRQGVEVHLRASKTDQEGDGRVLGVWRGRRAETCPVRALRLWVETRGRWAGPLFVRCDRETGRLGRRRLSGHSIGALVKSHAAEAGLDPAEVGAHSLRAGCVTAALQGGAGEIAVMKTTGHRSVETLRRYFRPRTPFGHNPLAGML